MSTLREILENSQYWGLTLSIGAYLFACWLKQKTKLAFLNPILVSVIVIIAVLLGVGIDYDTYNKGASYLSWLLTPATVCLASYSCRCIRLTTHPDRYSECLC